MKTAIDWLLPPVRTKVLALLTTHPRGRWHLRDIARQTGFALGTVRRELTGLAEVGIVTRIRDGNRTYYQVNAACPILPELTGLMRKTAGLADVLRDALAPLAGAIDAAFIYGSLADGTAGARSDVDLLVVGDVDHRLLHEAASRAEERLARPLNYTIFSKQEFLKRRKEKGGFLTRVLAGPRIFVVGDADAL